MISTANFLHFLDFFQPCRYAVRWNVTILTLHLSDVTMVVYILDLYSGSPVFLTVNSPKSCVPGPLRNARRTL